MSKCKKVEIWQGWEGEGLEREGKTTYKKKGNGIEVLELDPKDSHIWNSPFHSSGMAPWNLGDLKHLDVADHYFLLLASGKFVV